jgi:uncharacterized protein (TIGR03118 family)
MLHAHTVARRPGTFLSVALACLLLLVALPGLPPRAARAQASMPIPSIPPGHAYRQTKLASNSPGFALVEAPSLTSAWGLSVAPGRPFCVAANGTSLRFQGSSSGAPVLAAGEVTIPGGQLTACAANGTGFFTFPPPPMSTNPRVIEEFFVTLDGRLLGYHPTVPSSPSSTATLIASFGAGTLLTGITLDAVNGRIFLADFGNGRVIKLDQFFNVSNIAADPNMDVEYRPYNVSVLGGKLYVTYAKRDPGRTVPDNTFPGNGFVSVFDLDGNFLKRLISRGQVLAPWGLALAPPDFGVFGGSLIVANDTRFSPNINAFDPETGAFRGTLKDETDQDISINGLRGLAFGAGGNSGDPNTLYFTSTVGPGGYGLFGSLSPTTETVTSLIGFSPASFEVGEGAGHVDITVLREGDLSAPATVDYATVDEGSGFTNASQRSDYEIAVGKLTFAPGEASKTFRVLINGDSYLDNSEGLWLSLNNPTGTGVGLGRARTFLSIRGTPPPIGNPIDDAAYFVFQHYHDFLNREPDPSGHEFWTNQIAVCPTVPCRDERRANVSAAFFLSIEFQTTGMLNILAHQAAYGRRPLYGEFMAGTQALQRGVVFGAPGAVELIEANKQDFFLDFIGRLTFAGRYPTTMTPAQFVDALYANAGVTPTAEERAAAIAEFQGPGTTDANARARVVRRVAENRTFAAQEFNRAFVLMQYFGYLRREPDEGGFQFWLNKLNEHNGNYITAELVRAFIESAEYRRRFAPN